VVLEIIQGAECLVVHQVSKKVLGGIIGSDAAGDQKANQSIGCDQVSGEFGKEHIGVHIAPAGVRETAAVAHVGEGLFGGDLGVVIAFPEIGVSLFKSPDEFATVSSIHRTGDVGGRKREEFPLLEL